MFLRQSDGYFPILYCNSTPGFTGSSYLPRSSHPHPCPSSRLALVRGIRVTSNVWKHKQKSTPLSMIRVQARRCLWLRHRHLLPSISKNLFRCICGRHSHIRQEQVSLPVCRKLNHMLVRGQVSPASMLYLDGLRQSRSCKIRLNHRIRHRKEHCHVLLPVACPR